MPFHSSIYLRCPKDIQDADQSREHFALRVRVPIAATVLGELMQGVGECPCGATMVVLVKDEDG